MNKPRISLLNLLLITALVSMGFALFVAMRTHQNVVLENKQIKYDLGFIEVEDPSKIYIRPLDNNSAKSWRFRVHLPEGYRGRYVVGKTWMRNGKPDLSNLNFQNGTLASHQVELEGQYEETFSFMKLGTTWHFAQTGTAISTVADHYHNEKRSFGTHFSENVADRFLDGLQAVNTASPISSEEAKGNPRHGSLLEFTVEQNVILVLLEPNLSFEGSEVFVIALVPETKKVAKHP